MKILRKEIRKKRETLKEKYKRKIDHLEEIRKKEIAEKKKESIPEEIGFFKDCIIFDTEKFEAIGEMKSEDVCIGKVKLDADERAILKLNPNFAIMRYLDEEEAERDVELGSAKLRYELRRVKEEKEAEEYDIGEERNRKKIRTNDTDAARKVKRESNEIEDAKSRVIFDPERKIFDYTKRRVTDLKENSKITLPKSGEAKQEAEIEMIRKIIIEEFNRYRKKLEEEKKKAVVNRSL